MEKTSSTTRISPNTSRVALAQESPIVKSPLHQSIESPQKKVAAGHKDYLKNMLINKFTKKYPGDVSRRMIEIEVQSTMANEYITKENMKTLEAKILRRLNPPKSILVKRANEERDSVSPRVKYPLDNKGSILAGKKQMRNNK